MDYKYDAIIVGAGHNGLVTAGYLAKNGLSVLVLERLDKIGGAATTDEFAPGFSGPMCSYACDHLQGKVIDDLNLREHGFEFVHSADEAPFSMGFHPFPDGTFLGGPGVASHLDAANQIREFSEHDARSYFAWNEFWDRAAAVLHRYFLTEPPTLAEVAADVRGTREEEVWERLVTWSLSDLVEHHFDDERVRANFMSVTEADPDSPGSLFCIALIRCGKLNRPEDRGVPRMSMGTITKAMAESARTFGAEIRTRAPVAEVLVEGGDAVGVRLAGGEVIRGSVVVSNADPKRTFGTLFEPGVIGEETHKRLSRWKTSAGCVKLLAAMRELPDFSRWLGDGYDRNSVLNVRMMPSMDYHRQSWRDAASGRPTTCPIMHIQLTTTVEPDLAPRGGHVMSNWVLYETPDLAEGTWDDYRDEVGEQIIDVITEYAPNFRESLIDWTVQTPMDIEARVGMTDGNIRHLDMIPSQLLSQRQSYRTEVRGFYMCGAGTHPMGEVTGAPGHNAAHAILRDLEQLV